MSGATLKLNLRRAGAGIMLPVRLTPKASRDEIVGLEHYGDELVIKARVQALPESGRANAALERLIAHWLKVPTSSVKVAQGGKSRLKQLMIEGGADHLLQRVSERLAELGR